MTKQQSVKAVYNKLSADLAINAAPRNAAVVHESIMKLGRIVRTMALITVEHLLTNFSAFSTCCTVTGHWLSHFDRALAETFVRYIVATGEWVPSEILYTERVIHELKAFCFNGSRGSILSFDKTFNLGAIYVTVVVYKNLAVVRRKKNEHPLFIGPFYLHSHSYAET